MKSNLKRNNKINLNKIDRDLNQEFYRHKKPKKKLNHSIDYSKLTQGILSSFNGFFAEVILNDGSYIQCKLKKALGSETIVVGDIVYCNISNGNNQIVDYKRDRNSILYRNSDKSNINKFVAANIDKILIINSVEPKINTNIIDRYLIYATKFSLYPIIIFNKIDLLDIEEIEHLNFIQKSYIDLGYTV